MPEAPVGTEGQLGKDIKEIPLTKASLERLLSKTTASKDNKKVLEALNEIIVLYNNNFIDDNKERLKRLKATILNEFNIFYEYLNSYAADEHEKFIKDITEGIDKKLEELKSDGGSEKIDKISVLQADIIKSLQEIFSAYSDKEAANIITLLNNAKEELVEQKKLLLYKFQKYQLEVRKLKLKIKYNNRLSRSEINRLKAEETRLKSTFFSTISANNEMVYKNVNDINQLMNSYKTNLNKYYKAYVGFSKDYKYLPGIIENHRRKITKFIRGMGRKIRILSYNRAVRLTMFLGKHLVNNFITRGIKNGVIWVKNGPFFLKVKEVLRFIFVDNWIVRNVIKLPIKILGKIKDKIVAVKTKILAYSFVQKTLKLLAVGGAMILGPVLKLVSYGLSKAVDLLFFTLNTVWKVVSFSINFAINSVSFLVRHIVLPTLKPVLNLSAKAVKFVAGLMKKTFAAALFAFLVTREGAYALGYATGYIYTFLTRKSLRTKLVQELEKKFNETKSALVEKIQNSKAYQFYQKGKARLAGIVEKGRKVVTTLISVAMFAKVFTKRVINGLNNVFETFGLPIIENGNFVKNLFIAGKATSMLNVGMTVKAASSIKFAGAIGKIIAAAIAGAAVAGAFMVGYTQDPAFNPDDPKLTIKQRFKAIYGISITDFKNTWGRVQKKISGQSSRLDITEEDLQKMNSAFSHLTGEIEVIEELSSKLKEIRQLYEKHADEKGNLPGVFAFHRAFGSIADLILNSTMFGEIKTAHIPHFLENTGEGRIEDEAGTYYRPYTWQQQLTDIGVLNTVINLRKLMANSYIDAFKRAESGNIADLRFLKIKINNMDKDIHDSYMMLQDSFNRNSIELQKLSSTTGATHHDIEKFLNQFVDQATESMVSARNTLETVDKTLKTNSGIVSSANTTGLNVTNTYLEFSSDALVPGILRDAKNPALVRFTGKALFNDFANVIREFGMNEDVFKISDEDSSIQLISSDKARVQYFNFFLKNIHELIGKLNFINKINSLIDRSTIINKSLFKTTIGEKYGIVMGFLNKADTIRYSKFLNTLQAYANLFDKDGNPININVLSSPSQVTAATLNSVLNMSIAELSKKTNLKGITEDITKLEEIRDSDAFSVEAIEKKLKERAEKDVQTRLVLLSAIKELNDMDPGWKPQE